MPKLLLMTRRQTSGEGFLIALLFVIGLVVFLAEIAVRYWPVTLVVIAVVVWLIRRGIGKGEEKQRAYRAAVETAEAKERKRWQEMVFRPGSFSVILSGFRHETAEEEIAIFLEDLPGLRDQPVSELEALIERAVHISPQPIAEGIAQQDAVVLKVALEDRGAKVKITEGVKARQRSGREPIPKNVQREVWRRDGGQCVDCGSREHLEYDHIIPVSRGGSNTTRNIELRCKSCNRKKGAKIGGGVITSSADGIRLCPHCDEMMPRGASICPRCQKESLPWILSDGVWWLETDGAWFWLDEASGSWVRSEEASSHSPSAP
jgi:hypothetical protein